jgi:hypothetical protein
VIDFRTQLAEDVLAQIAATLRDAAGVVERIRRTEAFDARYALWGDFGVLLNQVDRLLPEDAAAV